MDSAPSTGSWRRNPAVLTTELDRELVLLDPRTRNMFTLNETGMVVWSAIDTGPDATIDAVVAAFAVDREVAEADVAELVAGLAGAGLIVAV